MKKFAIVLLFILSILVVLGFTKGKEVGPFKESTLQSVVEQSLNSVSGRYAVYIKNLKTGESLKWNENKVFEAGSLYKLWVMGAVFEKIKNGDLKEDDNLQADIEDINLRFGISSDEAELKEGKLQFSVGSALEQMITISHNYAALMLLNKVGSSNIPQKVTVLDVALFFEDLYKGQIIDPNYSGRMIDILSRQKISDRIPKYLPKGIKVAHKTGDIGYFEHDGGIIYTEKGDYIIVVLSETKSPQAADEQIAQISKKVYEYFNK